MRVVYVRKIGLEENTRQERGCSFIVDDVADVVECTYQKMNLLRRAFGEEVVVRYEKVPPDSLTSRAPEQM